MARRLNIVGLAFLLTACGGNGGFSGNSGGTPSGGTGPSAPQIAIQPMTSVNVAAGTGYFQDPYPIHSITAASTSGLPTFSGTTKQLLTCAGQIQRACFVPTAVTLDSAAVQAQAAATGSTINNFENLNIYQDSSGAWQMAVTAHLANPNVADWNVILHAHPTSMIVGVPTDWQVDTVLVGDLGACAALKNCAADNYDGKYFEDSGVLYLIYNKQLVAGQDGVVAQAMASATAPAGSDPVPLLGPETGNGGYNSELAEGLNQTTSTVKLIETGNVTRINGKYVMTYSVGTYNRRDYKSGIAWSDTFLPAAGAYYTRVQKIDTAGVWGQANHAEVQYLLQSRIAQWPNYVASQVLAPGVPAIFSDKGGNYYLSFAGYDPSDAPKDSKGLYQGMHRRPYYVGLNVQIPANAKVSATSPQALVNWIQPVTTP